MQLEAGAWNLLFAGGMLVGAFITSRFLVDIEPVKVAPQLLTEVESYGIRYNSEILPKELFSFSSLLTLRELIFLVVGGFLVGFGTWYAGGCTSGHCIMGISNLPGTIATVCFMAGGFILALIIFGISM